MYTSDSDSEDKDDIYSYLDKVIPGDEETKYLRNASSSLKDLLAYPFASREIAGEPDKRFNDVERIDVIRDKYSRTVRCPIRFLKVLHYIETIRGTTPSIGLRYKNGSVTNYVHFIIEETEEGWIYHDSQRSLQVPQIHKYEKILDHTGLQKVAIIANKVGVPAKNEISRINSERGNIFEFHTFGSINNHSLHDFF